MDGIELETFEDLVGEQRFRSEDTVNFEKFSFRVSKPFTSINKKAVLHGHVHEPGLKWNWGVREGVKYNRVEEKWLIAATYTHYHSRMYASLEESGVLTPIWSNHSHKTAAANGHSLASSWRLNVDLCDIEVGRSVFHTSFFTLRPHLGIRAAWMSQDYTIDYEQFPRGVLQEPSHWNHSLGTGLRGGLDTSFALGQSWAFFADGALSSLRSYHNLLENKLSSRLPVASIEYSLGLCYEKKWGRSMRHLTLKVGYEFNHFFNQSRWSRWFSPLADSFSPERLSFQGFSSGFRLDF